MPPYTEFMQAAQRAAKPAFTQMMRDARLGLSDAEHGPAGIVLMKEASETEHVVQPAYFQLMHDVQNRLANTASNPAAFQVMHEFQNGMHVAKTEMLYIDQDNGIWGMVIVLFFIAFILSMFYIFGFFKRIEAWVAVFLLFMVFVWYIDWMTSDHYNYYKTEPYQGIETNTAY